MEKKIKELIEIYKVTNELYTKRLSENGLMVNVRMSIIDKYNSNLEFIKALEEILV